MWCLPAGVTVLLVVQRVVYLQSELVFCRNVRIYPHTGQSNICTKHSRAAELMEADSAAPVWPAAGNGAATVTVTAAALCWCQWFLSMDWFGHADTMGGRRNEMKRHGLDGYFYLKNMENIMSLFPVNAELWDDQSVFVLLLDSLYCTAGFSSSFGQAVFWRNTKTVLRKQDQISNQTGDFRKSDFCKRSSE